MKNRNSTSIAPLILSASPVLLLGILLCSCTSPPPLELHPLPDLCDVLSSVSETGLGVASGEVVIRNNSEVHNGIIDLKKYSQGSVKADFYGPLGIAIASMQADSLQGIIMFEDRKYNFALNQTMDSLPFGWGKGLAFGEFIQIILGKAPASLVEKICKKQPDSIVKKRNTIFAIWKTDILETELEIKNRPSRIVKANFYFKNQTPFWRLKMSMFNHGLAHKVQFMEDDENYFSIRYTKVTLVKK